MKTTLALENLFDLVTHALPLALLIDENNVIRYISSDYEKILSPNGEEVVGKYILDVIPNSRLPYVLQTGKEEYGQIFILRNGAPVICNRMPLFDETGKIRGAVSSATFEDLNKAVALSTEIKRLRKENQLYERKLAALKHVPFTMDSVVGISQSMQTIKRIIEKTAVSDLSVLITGETGTGKEVLANAIHQLSSRRFENFVKINCAAIPKELLESELFGYTDGAFSGAVKGGKPGKFEYANNGTILLDEIGELPLPLQSKLLRVLQEREVERVGSLASISLDVRVICCTNQNLEAMVHEGTFRQDLYYRINVVELPVPPLRERVQDIPLLCDYFIGKFNQNHGCGITGLSDKVTQLFLRYSWPGNVRELEHVLERACVLSSSSGTLELEQFDFFLPRLLAEVRDSDAGALSSQRRAAEQEAIVHALAEANGNRTKAAQLLHISRSQFYQKLKQYHLG